MLHLLDSTTADTPVAPPSKRRGSKRPAVPATLEDLRPVLAEQVRQYELGGALTNFKLNASAPAPQVARLIKARRCLCEARIGVHGTALTARVAH